MGSYFFRRIWRNSNGIHRKFERLLISKWLWLPIDWLRMFSFRSNSPEYRTAVEHAFRSVLFGLMVKINLWRIFIEWIYFQEQQLEISHGKNLDEMESSTFVTEQFLTNVRNLIGYAIEAVHNGLKRDFILISKYLNIFRTCGSNNAGLFI